MARYSTSDDRNSLINCCHEPVVVNQTRAGICHSVLMATSCTSSICCLDDLIMSIYTFRVFLNKCRITAATTPREWLGGQAMSGQCQRALVVDLARSFITTGLL